MEDKVGRYWRTLAIIFIILCVIETGFICLTWAYGTKVIADENKCIVICSEDDAYTYDSTTNICSCYVNNQVSHTEYIK